MKILLLLLTLIVKSSQLSRDDCLIEWRRPKVTDILVTCGTSSIELAVQVCPVFYTGYNESHLILNEDWDLPCRATLDVSVVPPVARFSFPLNSTNACGSTFRTTSSQGTGVFAQFSNIETVKISGKIGSDDYTKGRITYNAELNYFYSCAYPLEYLINNTQIDVSSSSIAIRDNNGSFVSTLFMELYIDQAYQNELIIPENGIELRTIIYVEVKAINLTAQYHVYLDQCYASVSPLPSNSSDYNMILPCSHADGVNITENGDSQKARFNFPAFRFKGQNKLLSTYYLHCITRLCEQSNCGQLKTCSQRRKRDIVDTLADDKTYTLTSREIITKADASDSKEKPVVAAARSNSTVGLGVAVGILAFAFVIAFAIAAVFYRKLRN